MNVRRFALFVAICATMAIARAEDQAKNPLENAKAGQWVIQKSSSSAGGASPISYTTYLWVEKVDGRKITLKNQLLNADLKTGASGATEHVIDLDQKPAPGPDTPKPAISEEELEVKGKKLKCQKVEAATELAGVGKITSTSWTSSDVPIYGTVKVVVKDKDGNTTSSVELIDFGQEGAKEKPVAAAPGGDEKKPDSGGMDGGGMGGDKGGEGGR